MNTLVTSDENPNILKTAEGIEFVRTPDAQFENLPDWSYEKKYAVTPDGLRMAYSEAGPTDGEILLLLHGQPSGAIFTEK